ncbi:MAG TPA: class I SAM-dependent methyltransferase [bacterium]|nr:class I SAM-dependent methyltransferase [bacterium]
MNTQKSWIYAEKQIGKDYNTPEEVESYDARHGKFRDIERENEAIVDVLKLSPGHTVIDFGTGTGAFALRAAKSCTRVHAIDISAEMLACAKRKAKQLGLDNIVFHHAGFLSYHHDAAPVDAVVTNTALHHLPDFWKALALRRINTMMKTGGLFYLSDVVFSPRNTAAHIEQWIEKLGQIGGETLRKDAEAHIRDEFSTFDWILEGLLERSGFEILRKEITGGVIGGYFCKKNADLHWDAEL